MTTEEELSQIILEQGEHQKHLIGAMSEMVSRIDILERDIENLKSKEKEDRSQISVNSIRCSDCSSRKVKNDA